MIADLHAHYAMHLQRPRMSLSKPAGAPPSSAYFPNLIEQLEMVQRDIDSNHSRQAAIARNSAELDAALDAGKIAMVRCIEGGFTSARRTPRFERTSQSFGGAEFSM